MTKNTQAPAAYWITSQRQADYTVRAACTRGFSVVTAAAMFGAAHGSWWGWPILAVAAIGAYMSLANGYYELRETAPREWLARIALQSGRQSKGKIAANVSGVIESVVALALPTVAAWAMIGTSPTLRLGLLAASALFLASVISAIVLDTTWYNPDVEFPRLFLMFRALTGPLVALALAAEVMPAPWSPGERKVVALICFSLVLVQGRVRETDRALAWAETYALRERRLGRLDITDAAHNLVGGPFAALRRLAERRKSTDPDMWDVLIQVGGGLRETLHLDRSAITTADWPGLLLGRLDQISGQFGIEVNFDPPEKPFSPKDRELVRFVLEDLTVNAAKYGATLVEITLKRTGWRYIADVRDDGPPFMAGSWMRPGGGLERLERKLSVRGGGLALKTGTSGKVVTATWKVEPDTHRIEEAS